MSLAHNHRISPCILLGRRLPLSPIRSEPARPPCPAGAAARSDREARGRPLVADLARRPSCAAPAASSAPSLSSVAADPRPVGPTLFFFYNGRLAFRRGSAKSAPRDSARLATRPTPVERIRAARTSGPRRLFVCAVVGLRRPGGLPADRARHHRLLARGLVARTGSCLSSSLSTGSDRLLGAVVWIQGSGLGGARAFLSVKDGNPNGVRRTLDP